MTRIVILGGPRTGKTTLANELQMRPPEVGSDRPTIRHTDDLITTHDWSQASHAVANFWLPLPGPWIIEGVALARALRKWREAHPGEPPPVDRVIRLTEPFVIHTLPGQMAMAKGEETVWREIEDWILESGVQVEYRADGAAA